MVPNTWNDGCAQALSELKLMKQFSPMGSKDMNEEQASLALQIISNSLGAFVRSRSDNTTIAIAAMSNAALLSLGILESKGLPPDYEDLYNLLCRKQHDYGHENINNFGLIGVAVRICDKIARAENLKTRESNAVRNETVIDTYEDIIGYAVIALMLDAGTFNLNLEAKEYNR
jgi:hypothetical protein